MDVATLGIRVVYDDVTKATKAIADLTAAGDAAEKKVRTAAENMAAAFKRMREAAAQSGANAFASQLAQLDPFQEKLNGVANAAKNAHGGLGTLNKELMTVTRNILQLNPAVAQVTSVLGNMAVGAGPMIAILGGIAAVGVAYEALTQKTREQHKIQEEALKSLKAYAEAARAGIGGQLAVDVENARKAIARLQEQQDKISKQPGSTPGKRFVMSLITGDDPGNDAIKTLFGGKSTAEQLAEGSKNAATAQHDLEVKLGQTTGAIALQIARQKELNEAYLKGDYAIALINNKYDYREKRLANAAIDDAGQRATLDALALEMKKVADAQALLLKPLEDLKDYIAIWDEARTVFNRLAPEIERAAKGFDALDAKATGSYRQRAIDATTKIIQGAQGSFSAPKVESFDETWRKIVEKANKVTTEIQKQAQGINDATQAATGLAEAFGLIDKNVARAVNGLGSIAGGVGPLSDAIGRFQGGTGGIGSVLSAAGPIVGGFATIVDAFQSAADKQYEAAVRMMEAAEQFKNQSASFHEAAFGTGTTREILSLKQTYQDLFQALSALHPVTTYGNGQYSMEDYAGYQRERGGLDRDYQAQVDRIAEDFWNSIKRAENELDGPAGAYRNAVDDIRRAYEESRKTIEALSGSQEELTRVEALRDRQLNKLINDLEQSASSALLGRYYSLTGVSAPTTSPFLGDSSNVKWFDTFNDYLNSIEATNKRIASETEIASFWQQVEASRQQKALDVAQESLRVQEDVAKGLRDTVQALQKYSETLKLGSGSTLSSYQRYKTAESQFETLAAKAFAGDQEAARAITSGGGDTFLRESEARYGGSLRRSQDFNRVSSVVDALEGMFGSQLTAQDPVLAELQKQTAIATKQLDAQQDSLITQIVARANTTTNPGEIPMLQQQAHKLGFTLNHHGQLIDLGNGMASYSMAWFADAFGGANQNQPGQGNTGPGSTIYNPGYQSYVNAQGGNVPLDYDAWLAAGQPAYAARHSVHRRRSGARRRARRPSS
jgi:hypothetical protein